MPKMEKGYYKHPATGEVSEHDMYKADIIDACAKWPDQWSRTPPKAGVAAPKKK